MLILKRVAFVQSSSMKKRKLEPNQLEPNAKRATHQPPPTIDDLPIELLLKIFSTLPGHELLHLERVSLRWKTIIEENIWKWKTTISERDVDPLAPIGVQLRYLIALLGSVANSIEYFFFPNIFDILMNYKKDEEFIRNTFEMYLLLERTVTTRLAAGQLALHPTLMLMLQGIERIRRDFWKTLNKQKFSDETEIDEFHVVSEIFLGSRKIEPQLVPIPVQLCSTVIVPLWKIESGMEYSDGTEFLRSISYEQLANVQEIVFEQVESETSHCYADYDEESDPFRDDKMLNLFRWINGFGREMTLRVVKVSLHCLSYGVSIEIRLDYAKSFTKDEFIRLAKAVLCFKETEARIDEWREMVVDWRLKRRIEHAAIRLEVPRVSSIVVRELLKPRAERDPGILLTPLLSELFPSFSSSLIIDESCDRMMSLCSDLFEHNVLATLTELDISTPVRFGFPNGESVCFDEESSIYPELFWRVLTRCEGLANARLLRVDARATTCRHPAWITYLYPDRIPMPSLECLDVAGPLDYPFLVSVLRNSPVLRHLKITASVDHVSKRKEHLEWTARLLDAIGEKTALVSLSVTIGAGNSKETLDGQRLWLEAWLDCKTEDRESSKVTIHLRQDVVDALKKLQRLQYLEFGFLTTKCFEGDVDVSGFREDKKKLISLLPELKYLQMNDYVQWMKEEIPFLDALRRMLTED